MRVSRVALTQWEGNIHRPTDERLSRLSQILGCDLLAAGDLEEPTAAARTSRKRATTQPRDVSLVEAMSPLWRPREVSVFRTQQGEDPDIDLLILPDIAFRSSSDHFSSRDGVFSGVVVEGDRLRPAFEHGALMLLAGGSNAAAGDLVLVLGKLQDGQRPARFGRLSDRQGIGVSICRHDQTIKLSLPSTECEALFRVIVDV